MAKKTVEDVKPVQRERRTGALEPTCETKKAVYARFSWAQKFLESLSEQGIIKNACVAAGIHRNTAYDARGRCKELDSLWLDADDDAGDVLIWAATQRALGLVPKNPDNMAPSDNLLMFLIKKKYPEYRDNHDALKALEGIKAFAMISDQGKPGLPSPPVIDVTPE